MFSVFHFCVLFTRGINFNINLNKTFLVTLIFFPRMLYFLARVILLFTRFLKYRNTKKPFTSYLSPIAINTFIECVFTFPHGMHLVSDCFHSDSLLWASFYLGLRLFFNMDCWQHFKPQIEYPNDRLGNSCYMRVSCTDLL